MQRVRKKDVDSQAEMQRLESVMVAPSGEVNAQLTALGQEPLTQAQSASNLLRRPEMTIANVYELLGENQALDRDTAFNVETEIKYRGYIERQQRDVERFRKAEGLALPADLDYEAVPGLPAESRQRLGEIRPVNFGHASRIPGVRASDITILHIYLEKVRREREKQTA
jgi:tRNA uridine 5-carboxymethylaminomethyl modification enzyme